MQSWNRVEAILTATGLVILVLTLLPTQRRRTPPHLTCVTTMLAVYLMSSGIAGMILRASPWRLASTLLNLLLAVAAWGILIGARLGQRRTQP